MLQLQTTILVGIAIGAFQVALGSKFYDSVPCSPGAPCASSQSIPGPPCSPGAPCASGQPIFPLKHQPRRKQVSHSKKFSRSSKDPCISKFVDTFTAAVRSCQALSDLFGSFSHTSAIEFCNGKYPEILQDFIDLGLPNPEFGSQQAVEPIADNFDTLTCDIVIQVYANSMAKYLFTQGVLTPQNAAQLAKQYADSMEEAANCNDSEYAALNEGYVNFLDSLGLFTADKALLIALQYANEWKLAAKPRHG